MLAVPGADVLFPGGVAALALEGDGPLMARSRSCGLECRLSGEGDAVDVGVCIDRARAADLSSSDMTTWWREAIRVWTGATGGPWASIPYACIEVDRGPEGRAPSPLAWSWKTAFPFFAVSEAIRDHGPGAVLSEVFGALAPEATTRAGEELLAGLPEGSRVLHLTALAHRGRLELRAQATAASPAVHVWLARRPGPGCDAVGSLRVLLEGLPIPALSVQARATQGAVVPHAVEISLPHGPHGDPIWQVLLDRAVKLRLVRPEKAAAMMQWPGYHAHSFPDGPAPVRIDRAFHVTLRVDGDPVIKGYTHAYPRYVLV